MWLWMSWRSSSREVPSLNTALICHNKEGMPVFRQQAYGFKRAVYELKLVYRIDETTRVYHAVSV